MQVAVIVESDAGSVRDVVTRLRAAGFTEQLNLFVQPDATLAELSLDNVFIRRLKEKHNYNTLWRNIVQWWSSLRNEEQHLVIVDGSCQFCVSTAATLRYALANKTIAWGLISLFAPEASAFYFSGSMTGWNGTSIPVPLTGCCLSRHAADILLQDPVVWELDAATDPFPQAVMAPLARRGLIQAVHYPSLMAGPKAKGLKFQQDAIYAREVKGDK